MPSMVIVCEGCGARFRINYALFQDAKGARIRCRKCGGHIEARHPEASPDPPAPKIPFPLAPETSYVLEKSPTFQADIPSAVRPETGSSPLDEQAIPPVPASIEAETEIEPESVAEAAPAPVAEAHVPAEVEEEPTHAPPAPWMETVPPPDAPDAAPAGESKAAMVHSGHPGRWDTRPEELFLGPIVTDKAPEQDSSREEHAAEIASLKRRLRASGRRGPSMLTIFLFVVPGILLLAGGAFYFRNTKPAQELLRKFSPPSRSGNTASAVEKPAYEIRDMKSFHEKTFIGGNLFVIQGTVANVGKGPSRGIRVQATLLGKDNQVLVDNTVFAANLVDNTTLRHANRALIEGLLGVRYGDRNVNRDIPAGTSLPFMVVFFDPPGQIGYFTVMALDAE